MAIQIRIALGKRIRELRKQRSWRQIDLAEHSGINKTMICDLERGEREFCMETLNAIAGALDLRPSDLLRSVGR